MDSLLNLSTTTNTAVYPLDSGSPVIKSADRSSQGPFGTGSGSSFPAGALPVPLFLPQRWHAHM